MTDIRKEQVNLSAEQEENAFSLDENTNNARIRTVVITGGPCSGKTTALEWLRRGLEGRGWRLIFVPEVATELIMGGVAPWTCKTYDHFQHAVISMQLSKERAFRNAVLEMDPVDTVMILDRGIMDNGGYMTPEGFEAVMKRIGITPEEAYARYDAVFHLTSAAKGLEEAYTLVNNTARAETPEQAAEVDDRLRAAWAGHPNLHIVGNEINFADKMQKLLLEVLAYLNE